MKAKEIVNRFKPDVVIGVGGFASGPLLKVATKKKIPTLIQEQNSFPGVTNKLLAKHVNKICVAYDGMEKYFPKDKIVITGNPVRQDVVDLYGKADEAYKFFSLNPDLKTVFVVGGSLGAFSINESIQKCLPILKEKNIQLVWQTGKLFIERAKDAVKEFEGSGIMAYDFINRMDYAYSIADLVVSRAGAIAVSELCLVKKPCILVPFPFAAEDHQTKNAMALVNKDAAILIKDSDVREKLSEVVFPLLCNAEKLEELSENISNMAMKNSADLIADEVLKILK
jgi:UDP-N-acetylglucosamine--N-acetylmuramyl-(pentapeptide) pyrophosphoryl-undecaprenol N-acetylglucosamine transferase